jgi:hypothetical protein
MCAGLSTVLGEPLMGLYALIPLIWDLRRYRRTEKLFFTVLVPFALLICWSVWFESGYYCQTTLPALNKLWYHVGHLVSVPLNWLRCLLHRSSSPFTPALCASTHFSVDPAYAAPSSFYNLTVTDFPRDHNPLVFLLITAHFLCLILIVGIPSLRYIYKKTGMMTYPTSNENRTPQGSAGLSLMFLLFGMIYAWITGLFVASYVLDIVRMDLRHFFCIISSNMYHRGMLD